MKNPKTRGKGRVFPHGNFWWIDITYKGKRCRERIAPLSLGANGKKLAQAVLAKRLTEIAENKFLDVKRDCKVTFPELANKYLQWAKYNHEACERTDLIYIKHLKAYFVDRLIAEISKEDIERYRIKRRADGVGPYTINHELGALRQMFNLAIEKWEHPQDKTQYLFSGSNPATKFKREYEKSRDRALTKGELVNLMTQLTIKIETEKNPAIKKDHQTLLDVILLAVLTGMRKGEIQSLKYGSDDIRIDGVENHLMLRHTKNGSDRYVPLGRIPSEILSRPFNFDYNPKRSFGKLCEDAKVRNLRFHDLRRSFATFLVGLGTDPFTIAGLLGHELPGFKVTAIYARPQRDGMIAAIKKLENHLIEAVPSGFYGTGRAQTEIEVSQLIKNQALNVSV
ncbi:MAG: hypothetical protein HY586_01650 [Candidatus Omnitrophica bacterium]|nr:hypothetical protein [Candidatus Omnitrophota bacterium]